MAISIINNFLQPIKSLDKRLDKNVTKQNTYFDNENTTIANSEQNTLPTEQNNLDNNFKNITTSPTEMKVFKHTYDNIQKMRPGFFYIKKLIHAIKKICQGAEKYQKKLTLQQNNKDQQFIDIATKLLKLTKNNDYNYTLTIAPNEDKKIRINNLIQIQECLKQDINFYINNSDEQQYKLLATRIIINTINDASINIFDNEEKLKAATSIINNTNSDDREITIAKNYILSITKADSNIINQQKIADHLCLINENNNIFNSAEKKQSTDFILKLATSIINNTNSDDGEITIAKNYIFSIIKDDSNIINQQKIADHLCLINENNNIFTNAEKIQSADFILNNTNEIKMVEDDNTDYEDDLYKYHNNFNPNANIKQNLATVKINQFISILKKDNVKPEEFYDIKKQIFSSQNRIPVETLYNTDLEKEFIELYQKKYNELHSNGMFNIDTELFN
jgi:hypothetical protein